MSTYNYADEFFDYIEIGSRRSAQIVIQLLLESLQPLSLRSVLDVGCGRGVWLEAWRQQQVSDILGVDGSYVEPRTLAIPSADFQPANLAEPLRLGRRFDLVQSLEVAEHIPAQFADIFVKNLTSHGDLVLFSAAPPGQGGEFHVNEQDYSYWRDKFAQQGYMLLDFLRPQLVNQTAVEPWYRYNTLLFVRAELVATLPDAIQARLVLPQRPVKDYAPLTWQIRRAILSRLPKPVVSWMAMVKHKLVLAQQRLQKR
jgi:SAM-dependent methyltransferase